MNSLCTSLIPHVPFVIYVILFVLRSQKKKMNSFSSSPSSSDSERKSIPNLSHHAMEPYSKWTKNYAIEQTFVYDVLLNFYSGDTGKSFCSHLLGALKRHGFTVFDHKKLSTGHNECSQLLKAIQESKIYVLVFSLNYAVSERCLDELVDIMDHHKYRQRKNYHERNVLPVFFNIEPSDVRNQQGPYKEAFEAHETTFDIERVQKWRQALKEAGALSGLHLQNGDEEEFVWKIVEEVEKMQNPQELHVADHPVGISSRVEELISILKLDSEDVSIVAVLGISGIGKTTIAKAMYNRIAAKFDASCFLEDVDRLCVNPDSELKLQMELITRLAQPDKCQTMLSRSHRITKIERLICCRKVLVVLDDVGHYEQLRTFAIPSCFHRGSRIVVTTRDEQFLSPLKYIRYNPTLLDREESLELFTRLTSGQDDPFDKELVKEIVYYADGLPLVLEVLGRHFKCYPRELWPRILETLKRIPHSDVQKKLKISYDSLTNIDKKLFLDIGCFFVGYSPDYVVEILQDEDSALFLDVGIQNLVSKGLVRMEAWLSTLSMHHAIMDMAREIVRQENENEPGQRSRLWDKRDVLRVLTEYSGTEKVESIIHHHTYLPKEDVTVPVEAFRKMSNLRLLQLRDYYDGGLSWTCSNDDMPPLSFKKLKYLDWLRFPLKSINIDMSNVVVVHLQRSKLEILWEEGMKSLKKLRILDVDRSSSLTKTGNFYGVENLEELSLRGCENLEELDNSIGCLDKLVKLDLRRCRRLRKFPFEVIGKLRSLKILDLSKCRNIGLERDEVIDPFLSSLKECSITELHLAGCNILKISNEIGSLTSLEHLDLRNNGFPSLPDSLGKLCQLKTIDLSDCASLKSIPTFPENIEWIYADHCKSLMNLPSNVSELHFLQQLFWNHYD